MRTDSTLNPADADGGTFRVHAACIPVWIECLVCGEEADQQGADVECPQCGASESMPPVDGYNERGSWE